MTKCRCITNPRNIYLFGRRRFWPVLNEVHTLHQLCEMERSSRNSDRVSRDCSTQLTLRLKRTAEDSCHKWKIATQGGAISIMGPPVNK